MSKQGRDVLFAGTGNQVFEEVDRQVVAVAEVGFDVDSEEDVDLSLRAELGREGSGGNLGFLGVDLLHHKTKQRLNLIEAMQRYAEIRFN